jgi:branched-chain amino acid transport system substrate-binding protein
LSVRRSRAAGLAIAVLAASLAGCGSSGTQAGGYTYEKTLTVYSDLPLQGPQGALMASINDGETLALEQAHARGLDRNVSIALINDAQQAAGGWDRQTTSHAAEAAGQDIDAVAYIGDFDSAASAISLPLINENDILQVSPASPYIGLTDANPLDQTGEPAIYYPSGNRTFARLSPSDVAEASATASFMRSLDVRRVYLLSDTAAVSAPYDSVIARMVAGDAASRGITVVGSADVDTADGTRPSAFGTIAGNIAETHADAVLLGAAPDTGAQALWQELHAELPGVKLFAPSTLATTPFLRSLATAAGSTYVTSPILPLSQYPASAQVVLADYRQTFGVAPTADSLYGYEAMASVLAAIQRAGKNAHKRLSVVDSYFQLGLRHSVIGTYRISRRTGDSSLTSFAGYRVGSAGQLIELRRLSG